MYLIFRKLKEKKKKKNKYCKWLSHVKKKRKRINK